MIAKRPSFELSTETQEIIERLERASITELITYRQLLDLTGFQDVEQMRPYLRTARRQLWQRHVYTRIEHKQGVLRVDGDGAVDCTSRREESLTRQRRRLQRDWEAIINATAEKAALKTKSVVKHEMMNALESLYRKRSFTPPIVNDFKLNPLKVLQLFQRKAG
ncbi:MAG TPA: hypothetical protein VH187_01445 [Scandinavium sp.]|uniref:hypothetical protein n=1 Tax=Scandinavium sp. TaxID=2830653 RepID=UPI002E376989|nr:hypothetical protein [Scandinavium sp.]HEX4499822.1 hypothetical protein [Scandinavium sp.]